MHVVYKKMTCDRAKSSLAKWNLTVGIQFKPVKKLPDVHIKQWFGMFWWQLLKQGMT